MLAEKVGITHQTISAIEKGWYSPPPKLAFKGAKVFTAEFKAVFRYGLLNEEGVGRHVPQAFFPAFLGVRAKC